MNMNLILTIYFYSIFFFSLLFHTKKIKRESLIWAWSCAMCSTWLSNKSKFEIVCYIDLEVLVMCRYVRPCGSPNLLERLACNLWAVFSWLVLLTVIIFQVSNANKSCIRLAVWQTYTISTFLLLIILRVECSL